MNDQRICPQCGTPQPAQSIEGLCPKCLLLAGLASEPAVTTPSPIQGADAPRSPGHGGFVPPELDEIARAFPQLEVLELIGRGGMGAVYKARQRELDRLVALKILPPEVGRDPAFAQRFAREARALAKLNHPHIVTIFDSGQSGGLYYLMMEYVDGVNLRQTIRAGELTPPEALAIVPQICDALQYAHDEGIVHRDIKPENILVDKRGRVKIADFGLAKLLASGGRESPESALQLTGTEQVMGTLRYMAPEQMESAAHVDHRADIYSLGVVFYELLTGEVPMGRFEPPSKRVQVDVRLDEIVLRTLEREPNRRYQRASEVKTDVQSVTSSPAIAPAVQGALRRVSVHAAASVEVDLDAARHDVNVPALALMVVGLLYLLISIIPLCVLPTLWFLLPIDGMPTDEPKSHTVAWRSDAIAGPLAAIDAADHALAIREPDWDLLDAALLAQSTPQGSTPTWTFFLFGFLAFGLLLQLPLCLVMIIGGWRMQRLESHGLAVLASLIALLPCQPLWPLGFIVGIWSLIVLNRPHIKAAFAEQHKRPPGALAVAPSASPAMPTAIAGRDNVEQLVVQALPHGKIEAIRVFRKATGAHLAEAKAAVETIARLHGIRDVPLTQRQRLMQIALPAAALAVAALVITAAKVDPLLQGIVVIGGAVLLVAWYFALWMAIRRERASAAIQEADTPRLHPLVIIGAIWALLLPVGLPAWQLAVRRYFDDPQRYAAMPSVQQSMGWIFLILAVTSPLATVLGGIAVAQIKRHPERFYGLPLAFAVAMFCPLLLGGGAIAYAIALILHELLQFQFETCVAIGLLPALVACFFTVRSVWRLVNPALAADPEKPRGKRWLFTVMAIGGVLLVSGFAVGTAGLKSAATKELPIAARAGDLERVKLLLARGADPDAKDELGNPAIVAAAIAGQYRVIETLHARGANVNARDAQGETALMEAAFNGHLHATEMLGYCRAEPNLVDNEGQTALYWALAGGHATCVEKLFQNGGDLGLQRKDSQGRPMLAVAAAHCPAMVLKLIVNGGAEVDERDNLGRTPLMHAAAHGHLQAIEVLIVNSADVNAQDLSGLTPLDWAVFRDQPAAVKLLLEKGVEKSSLCFLWEGYRLALAAQFAAAAPLLATAVEKSPASGSRGMQIGKEEFLAIRPKLLALAALAECELRTGDPDNARKHYTALKQLVAEESVPLYSRIALSPRRMATGEFDADNHITTLYMLTPEALQQVLAEPLQPPVLTARVSEVATSGAAGSISRTERNSSGTAQGLFAK